MKWLKFLWRNKMMSPFLLPQRKAPRHALQMRGYASTLITGALIAMMMSSSALAQANTGAPLSKKLSGTLNKAAQSPADIKAETPKAAAQAAAPAPSPSSIRVEPAAVETRAAAAEESAPLVDKLTINNTENGLTLGVGKSTMVQLPRQVTEVFIANNKIADVSVSSPTALYIFGITEGETSVYATDKKGRVVYSTMVRISKNVDNIRQMLSVAMPGAAVEVIPLNGLIILQGTVAQPSQVEEAERLVKSFVSENTQILNKLRTATPMQVNLQVKVAEVSRQLIKQIGFNLAAIDPTGGLVFGIDTGRGLGVGGIINDTGRISFQHASGVAGGFGIAGKVAGVTLAGMIDMLEADGVVSTLAEPTLTALSGSTSSFLAGGEFPLTVVDGTGRTSIEFKQYGVSLAFTPTVLENNRISLRVRPEVSELSDAGAVKMSGITIPGITTRRAETTVELGSGQSIMIGGLINNRTSNSADRVPLLGDLPLLGALFRSQKMTRSETEIVIIVTPYLVNPTTLAQLRLPTDAYRAPSDVERWIYGKTYTASARSSRVGAEKMGNVKTTNANSTEKQGAAPGFSNQ